MVKLMQSRVLGRFLKLIPIESPRLDLKLYTKIFEYFLIEMKDYASFKEALTSFPAYLVN